MLWNLGKTTPLVVVFTGLCCGILGFRCDLSFLAFAVLFAILLTTRELFIHLIIGLAIGVASVFFAPQWTDVSEGEHFIEGTIIDAGFSHGTFKIILDELSIDKQKYKGHAQIKVYEHVKDLNKGSVLKGYAVIKHPRKLGNPGEFDYQMYLLTHGITLAGYIKDFRKIEVAESSSRYGLKKQVVSMLSGLARPEAEVLKAVLTGDRSGLTYSLRDSFALLGVAHLLAISGLHMGIIILIGYITVFSVLRLVTPLALRCDTPFFAKIGGLVCAFIYTIFSGASVPTLRAMIMASCLIGSLAFLRKANLLESLTVSGIIILVFWPLSLYSASFLLSFTAVLGITAIYSRFERYPKWILTMLIPVGATVFTLPVVLYLFGFVSPYGIVSNLVCVPFFSIAIMPIGILGLLFTPISEPVASFLYSICIDGIGFILTVSNAVGMLKPVATPWIIWIFVSYVGLVMAFFARQSKLKTIIVTSICIVVLVIPFVAHKIRVSKPLCFDFISVGQGDSALVTKGSYSMLIDAGGSFSGFDTGRFVVGPYLLQRGISRIDLVVITHPHPDHIGGIPFILDRFEVGEVWINTRYSRSPYLYDVLGISQKKSVPLKTVSLGDTNEVGEIKISVLNPKTTRETGADSLDQNLLSIVLKVSDNDICGLFMADADGFGEIKVCRLGENLSADVLKVSHHGSRRSCKNMLLDKVKPKIAVISCGYANRYNLPNKDMVKRLKSRGIKVYRTDLDGEIQICPDKLGIKVK
jgi:competence protein ComEC